MYIQLIITGVLLIALALVHFIFPSYFNWKKELPLISLVNRQLMTIHTFFIALTVLLMGLLCLVATDDLINTRLGKVITTGLAIFWTIRLIIQFFGYSPKLWKGKTFETIVHVFFVFLWIYLSFIFWWVAVI
jgi:hypothetical protein